MPNKNSANLFNVEQVTLAGSNMIEASAGTGKTYSIGILVIRLLLECKISIKEMLMVTFTKAAVAELQTRVRSFIMEAEKASLGVVIGDDKIAAIVNRAIQNSSAEEVSEILRNARIFLDEIAVFTIHGFCQRTLSEFAFETGQLFGAEALSTTEATEIKQDAINNFWRKNVTTLDAKLLQQLMKKWLSRQSFEKLIDEALSGKKIEVVEPLQDSFRSNSCPDDFIQPLHANILEQQSKREEFVAYITDKPDEIRTIFKTANKENSELLNLLDFPILFAKEFKLLWDSKKPYKYIREMTSIGAYIENYKLIVKQCDAILIKWINQFFQLAIETILAEIEKEKKQRSRISFDDMIHSMYQTVTGSGANELSESVRKKYKAVFIDEFQDTDRWQYEIFHRIFEGHSILFYIGDPKQSIYGWRKADIFTYFRAVASVNSKFYMDTNFRSAQAVIDAQNTFFKPTEDHDTFHFEQATERIDYQSVNSPNPNTKGELCFNDMPVVPFTVFDNANEDEVVETVTAQVIQLLESNYTLPDKSGGRRRIKPSDIGILVRKNKQGTKVKTSLSKFKIPAVTIDETKLFETEEAQELLYILEAVEAITISNINRAMITKFTGWRVDDLKLMDEQKELKKFKEYQSTWKEKGIYVMLRKFMADFKVRSVLMEKMEYNGDRILSNLLQLMELLHKIQTSKELSSAELLHWLKKGIEGAKLEGEEYEQRVESDEEAVNIVTIHKSKGLEYNIVFIPFMTNNGNFTKTFSSYRVEADGSYHFDLTDSVNENAALQQQIARAEEQENRRLIYVAITRARYKCFINNAKGDKSLLKHVIPILKTAPVQNLIEFVTVNPSLDFKFKYRPDHSSYPVVYDKAPSFQLEQLNWKKMSYTALSPEHPPQPMPVQEVEGVEYDHFIFKELKKGAFTGNLLHYLFERIDFRNSEKWEKIVTNALKRLGSSDHPAIIKGLLEMLHHVMHVRLSDGVHEFSLAEIGAASKITEMEFDFVVKPFDTKKIAALSSDIRFAVKPYDELEGIMNGKVDLIFKYGNKYYILDWKSNHLGYDLNSYNKENLMQAMDENNYHLQYHIYTDALDRYLKLRLPGYDYEQHFGGIFYLFLRGIRQNAQSGVFFRKPDINLIGQFPWGN